MHPVETFELVLALLAGVVALHWAARRIGLPPAIALLVGGGGLAFVPGLPGVALDPGLALLLFLPPLLLDGAYYTAFGRFRRHLPGILSLAVGAVIFTTLVVGLVVHWLVPGLPWAACFALGAIVSPPDAVSARAVLQGVTLPRRLSALLEGESLLNDATGLVLFRFAVAATLSGVFHTGAAVSSFVFLALGGVVVGAAVSVVWMVVVKRLKDQTLIIMANTLMCWIAYIAGEAAHVSGVIATVVAGLVLGWYQHIIFPAQVRLRGGAFWQTLVFILEALVFILIGFSLRGVLDRVGGVEAVSTTMAVPVLGVVLAVVVARFIWVFVEAHAYDDDGTLIHPQMLEQARKRAEAMQRYAAEPDSFMERAQTHFDVVLIALAAGRAELIRQHRAGLIEDEVLHDLERDLDVEELGIILQRAD
jgi:NhaP-type Na+/H+ or K+/H+ antiporter